MLRYKLYIRGFSRLMAVMFAVQIMVGGFCLLTAEAHAMPASVHASDMDGHCAKSMHTVSDSGQSDHSGNCYHCDQPDELSTSAYTYMAPVVLVLSDIISLSVAPQLSRATTGMFSAQTPTGPPRSSSLLYTTTQRIRV